MRTWLLKTVAALVALMPVPAAAAAGTGSAWEYQFTGIDGQVVRLADFRGKALLVVNTASQCGFTPQYEGLQALWDRYRDRGLVVIGVPSNDFGGQEPGSAAEIREFCETTFQVSFPLMDKVVVSGAGAHPFYRWAADQVGVAGVPRWNFHKYLIAPDGRLDDWFSTLTRPDDSRLTAAIETLLPNR